MLATRRSRKTRKGMRDLNAPLSARRSNTRDQRNSWDLVSPLRHVMGSDVERRGVGQLVGNTARGNPAKGRAQILRA
jgi:hypothetical protein